MSLPTRISLSRSSQSVAASAPDARADGGVRQIRLSPRGVRIERQVAGIKMLLAVPIHGYEGVVLTCDEHAEQRLYKIALVHQDPELTIELHEALESPAVLTIWRSWADFFAKPALYRETASAAQRELYSIAWPRPRRRGQPLNERRPRFLKRRRCGRLDRIGTERRGAQETSV